MKTDLTWSVVTIPGHLLEKRLQQFTEECFEIVSITHVGTRWTIIARSTENKIPKGKVIGFGK